jgi:hypothetical protein
VSKNNVGVLTTLILIVLLSQSRFFDFLIDTHLGRMCLLIFVMLIAYTSKILGLFAVLCVILAFNHNEMNMVYAYNLYEGFDGSGNMTDGSGNQTIQNKLSMLQSKEQTLEQKLNAVQQQLASKSPTSTTGSESFRGREGFCMTDRETNMLRGKQSNTVPVFNNSREQSDDISPTDTSMFKGNYASF